MNDPDQLDDVEFVPIDSELVNMLDRARGGSSSNKSRLSRNEYLRLLLSEADKKGRNDISATRTDGGGDNSGNKPLPSVSEYADVDDNGKKADLTDFEWIKPSTALERSASDQEISTNTNSESEHDVTKQSNTPNKTADIGNRGYTENEKQSSVEVRQLTRISEKGNSGPKSSTPQDDQSEHTVSTSPNRTPDGPPSPDGGSQSRRDPWESTTAESAEPWCGRPTGRRQSSVNVGSFSVRQQTGPSQPSTTVSDRQVESKSKDMSEDQSQAAPEPTSSESPQKPRESSNRGTSSNEKIKANSNRMSLSGVSSKQTSEDDVPVWWGIVSWSLAIGVYGGGDLVTTWFALTAGAGEANPLMRAVMGVDPLLGILVKAVILVVLFAVTHSVSSRDDENNQLSVVVPLVLVVIGGYASVKNIGNISNELLPFVLVSVLLLSVSGGAAVALYHDMNGKLTDYVTQFGQSDSENSLLDDSAVTDSDPENRLLDNPAVTDSDQSIGDGSGKQQANQNFNQQ